MGWSIGYSDKWKRDIGYGVPAVCDNPHCSEKIDRGLSYLCGDLDGEHGCGLYFCATHLVFHSFRDGEAMLVCHRCDSYRKPFTPKPDAAEWVEHKATDPSWAEWRADQEQTEQLGRDPE